MIKKKTPEIYSKYMRKDEKRAGIFATTTLENINSKKNSPTRPQAD
jgi:hypothetical protein